jgi:hypothetical protein
VPGVARRVLEHVVGQRTPRPVRALEFLRELDAEVLLEQRRQTERVLAQHGGGDLRVEEPAQVHAEVAIEQPQVVVRAVHQHFHGGIFQRTSQGVAGV